MKFSGTTSLSVALLALLGCSNGGVIERLLTEIFPQDTQITIIETCSVFLGATVTLFSIDPHPSFGSLQDQSTDGSWARSPSLYEFAETDTQEYPVAGVGITILDGKNCLRDISDEAETILFGENSGAYYRSRNRKIVAVVFDEPKGHGVLFTQAP